MTIIKSGDDSRPRGSMLPGTGKVVPAKSKGKHMFEVYSGLRSRRLLTLFFACLSGITAISTAVVPALVHI